MKTETGFAAAILVGISMKVSHISGANETLMIVLTALALVYFFGAFYFFSDVSLKQQELVISILSGVCLSFIVVGFMFCILHLSGATEMLELGIVPSIILLGVCAVRWRSSKPGPRTKYIRSSVDLVILDSPIIETKSTVLEPRSSLRPYYLKMVIRLAVWITLGLYLFI